MGAGFSTSRRSVLAGMTAVAGSLTFGRSALGMLDAPPAKPDDLIAGKQVDRRFKRGAIEPWRQVQNHVEPAVGETRGMEALGALVDPLDLRRGAPEPFGVYAEWQTSAR